MNKHLGSSFESYLAQQPPTVWYMPRANSLIVVNTTGKIETDYGCIDDPDNDWLTIIVANGGQYIGEL